MIRVTDLERSLRFYTEGLGLKLLRRDDFPKGRFTLAFLGCADSGPEAAQIELTHNWDTSAYQRGDAFGHIAFQVASIADTQAIAASLARPAVSRTSSTTGSIRIMRRSGAASWARP